MSTVRDLISRFGSKPGAALTPVDFAEHRKRALEEEQAAIKAAREKATAYNAALRVKSLAHAKKQSLVVTPQTISTASPAASSTPTHSGEDAGPLYIAGSEKILSSSDLLRDENAQLAPPSPSQDSPAPAGVLVDHTATISANPLYQPRESAASATEEVISITNDVEKLNIELQETDELQPSLGRSVSVRTIMELDTSGAVAGGVPGGPRESSVTLDGDVMSEAAFSSRDTRSPSATMKGPGYQAIHDRVYTNRPSVSDLLLRVKARTDSEEAYDDDDEVSRKDSITSVGPTVEVQDPSTRRLDPDVSIRIVLSAFYETYAPEKLEDLELVLNVFRDRTDALIHTLECKYFVCISPRGIVTPVDPSEISADAAKVEDERVFARKASRVSQTMTDYTDLTTDSYKGYPPRGDSSFGATALGGSFAITPKHNSAGLRRGIISMKGAKSMALGGPPI